MTVSMDELLPSSSGSKIAHAGHRPRTLLREAISPHSSSGPSSTQIDDPYKIQKIGKLVKGLRKKLGKILIRIISSSSMSVPRVTTIDILPDDVLLQIFDLCQVGYNPLRSPVRPVSEWHRLIHVCRRWRQIIFLSPRRLDLYLLCTHGTPVRKNLGHLPAFPILIDYVDYPSEILSPNDEDSIIAALERPDRVRCLKLPVTSSLLGKLATVAQEQFPILTQLHLSSKKDENVPVIHSSFLGGSAPFLQEIHLEGIAFPTLPTFLPPAIDLVALSLHRIPHIGYISPEAMVAGLATLTRLDDLYIAFQSPASRPHQSGIRSLEATVTATRAVLPSLTSFVFRGSSEYLEDLVAQIDAPHLDSVRITYFNQLVFQVPQLFRFVGQTQILEQARTMDAQIYFHGLLVYISLYSGPVEGRRIPFHLRTSCQGLDWQVSHLTDVLSQYPTILSNVGHLFIGAYDLQPSWRDDMDPIEWLELFRQFTAVETLQVSALLAAHVSDALKDLTVEMVPEIFPALRLLCLEHEPVGRVEEFISARQLSGLPVAIVNTPKEFLNRRESHLQR